MAVCNEAVLCDLATYGPLGNKKWKVENSWGSDIGKEGVFIMNEGWFIDNVFQVVINRDYLSEEDKKNFEKEPIVLPIWDPLGSLARI